MVHTKITETELNALDNKLLRYATINREIATRREELQFPYNSDVNSGGSKTNSVSRPTEEIVVKFNKDVKLKNLELFKETVEHFLKNLDKEQMEIFELRWMNTTSIFYYTWEEIGAKLHMSRKTIYRKRRVILEKFAQLL
nr:transcriptional regulator [uncultured phage]